PDLDLSLGPGHGLLERDLHADEQVGSPLRAPRPLSRTAAKERVEDVAEARELRGEAPLESPGAGIAALRGVGEGLVAHAVVLGALAGVREGGIGLVDLL